MRLPRIVSRLVGELGVKGRSQGFNAHGRVLEGEPDAVIAHAEITRRFRDEIRHDHLNGVRLEPIRTEHVRRSYDRAAPAVKPLELALRDRIRLQWHLRDLPAERDAV